ASQQVRRHCASYSCLLYRQRRMEPRGGAGRPVQPETGGKVAMLNLLELVKYYLLFSALVIALLTAAIVAIVKVARWLWRRAHPKRSPGLFALPFEAGSPTLRF